MEIIKLINFALTVLFTLCYAYQFFYLPVPLLKKDTPHMPARHHRYAVLISARNEAAVIGHLLESIRRQDYPSDLVTVFVVADNCTDETAQTARSHGAVVYERFNRKLVGKGYALNFLLRRIERDYGPCFDGFFVFDADNLLEPDYISQMNRTFSDGYEIVTSYRNSKNYGDNWISAGYALWFLRESEFLNHARMLLGTSCGVNGTGFLFSHRVLKAHGGWHFFLLTEDVEFTAANITAGARVAYCPDAVLYDEQPVTFRQSWRQRMRWARGYLQVLRAYGKKLVSGITKRRSFACFDMLMSIAPAMILTSIGLCLNVAVTVLGLLAGQGVLTVLWSLLKMLASTYLLMFFLGAVTTVTQWREIHTGGWKKVLYMFTFPIFMLTYIPISIVALFVKVEWKPIEHNCAISMTDIQREKVG